MWMTCAACKERRTFVRHGQAGRNRKELWIENQYRQVESNRNRERRTMVNHYKKPGIRKC